MRHTAERQASLFDRVSFEFQRGRDRYQRERIGKAIADFQVGVICHKAARRKLDRYDDLVRLQVRVALRRVPWEPMEIRKRNRTRSRRSGDMDRGVEGGQRHTHVGGMRRNARLARAEDRVHTVEARDGGAAAAGLAFIAGRRDVVEVIAARALQKITAGRRHVAQLRRGTRQDRAREYGIALRDQRMVGEVGIRHQRADPQSPVRRFLDGLERQPRDVDQPRGAFDILLHQVDQVGAAGNKFRPRIAANLAHRISHISGSCVLEIDHDCPAPSPAGSPLRCWDTHRSGRYCRS